MKTFLVTGGAGFVGSHIALSLKARFENADVKVLDNLLRRGSEQNIPLLEAHGIKFFHGDVRIREDLENVGHFDSLIECSAEPSVLAGSSGSPAYVINTNLNGLINCAELCRRKQATLVFLSTSRVYPVQKLIDAKISESDSRFDFTDQQTLSGVSSQGISEDFPLQGYRSYYGASKYAAEVILEEYRHSAEFPIIINRCGVLAGPRQFGKADQGIVPFWLKAHMNKEPLKYIGFNGSGKQVRDMLHIDDLVNLIEIQLRQTELFKDDTYNVGGGLKNSLSLVELTKLCQSLTGNTVEIEASQEERYADIPIYITDNSKIQKVSSWRPVKQPLTVLEDIYRETS